MCVFACAVLVTTLPQAVIYAATCDWDADKRTKADGSPLLPHEDLRYYARGVFTWPQVGWHYGMPHGGVPTSLCNSCLCLKEAIPNYARLLCAGRGEPDLWHPRLRSHLPACVP
jgi:hypothetical protein